MSSKIYPIIYKEKEIYYTDWSSIRFEAEAMAVIEETTSFVETLGKYNLLEIVDVRDSIAPASVVGILMASAKRVKPFSGKKAIIGVTGTKMLILKAVNQFVDDNIKPFDTIEEAKEWLLK